MSESPNDRPARPEDSSYNNPSRHPTGCRNLAQAEAAEFDRQDTSFLEDVSPDPTSGDPRSAVLTVLQTVRRWVRTSLFILLLGVLVVGLYLYAAALDFISQVAGYPVSLQWPVWLLLVLVLGLVLFAILRIAVLWRSLSKQPQVALIQAGDADGDEDERKAQLTSYLNTLVRHAEARSALWNRYWQDAPQQAQDLLRDCRKLAKARPITTDAWLEEFERNVLRPLDAAAAKRITHYWRLVGIKTAISPFPLVDSLAVIYNNFLLIGDLAFLYGRKLSRHEVFILLWVIIFQIFIATRTQELFDSVAEDMTQTIQSGMARSVAQFIAPKVAEGTVHALVTWRIGKRAQRLLRPIATDRSRPLTVPVGH